MLLEREEGFEYRSRGKKKTIRYKMYSAGPFDHCHGDGNEKLRVCGFPIYIIRERSCSLVVWLDTRPNILSWMGLSSIG
jgi:hypothetical protein